MVNTGFEVLLLHRKRLTKRINLGKLSYNPNTKQTRTLWRVILTFDSRAAIMLVSQPRTAIMWTCWHPVDIPSKTCNHVCDHVDMLVSHPRPGANPRWRCTSIWHIFQSVPITRTRHELALPEDAGKNIRSGDLKWLQNSIRAAFIYLQQKFGLNSKTKPLVPRLLRMRVKNFC